MSLIFSSEDSMFGGEAESDGSSVHVTEATGTWGHKYTHITAFQEKVTAEPQEESMRRGSVKAMVGVQTSLNLSCAPAPAQNYITEMQGRMERLNIEDVDLSFKDKCFLLGDVRPLAVTTSGISTALQTTGEGLSDCCCAHFQAPEGVVNPRAKVTIHYAVILEGLFKFPKGYRRVSSVLFLHCNDPNQLQKEVTIQLRHWADICSGKESGLCFMKANHNLGSDESDYDFQPLEGGNFEADLESGTVHLKSHFCLLCIAMDESKGYTSDRCYAILCHKRFPDQDQYRICIVHAIPSWFEAIREFYFREPGEDALSYSYRKFTFQDRAEEHYVYLSAPTLTESGAHAGWQCTVLQNKVYFENLVIDENLQQSHKYCVAEIRKGIYPPSLKFSITYEDRKVHNDYKQKVHTVSLEGSDKRDEVIFEIVVFEPPFSPLDPVNRTVVGRPIQEQSDSCSEVTNPSQASRFQTYGGKMMVQRDADDGGQSQFVHPFVRDPMQGRDIPVLPIDESDGPRLKTEQLLLGTSPFSASRFLSKFENEFLDVVDAKLSLVKLKHKGVIPFNVKVSIMEASDDDAKYILFEHLEKNSTEDTMREYCRVLIAAKGFPKMVALGHRMMKALPPDHEANPPPQRGHYMRYRPSASMSGPADRLPNTWQAIPEETGVDSANYQCVGTRAQTTPRYM